MKTKNTPFLNKFLLLKNLIKSGFLATGLLLSSFASFAATTKTSNLPISSTVSNSCVVKSTDNINLGSYNPSNFINLNGSGVLNLVCTKGAVVTAIPISGGSTLTGSGGSLSYGLYTDSGLTNKWGSGAISLARYTIGTQDDYQTINYNAYFANSVTLSGHLNPSQIQALQPGFNSNLMYYYNYNSSSNTTQISYNYLGTSTTSLSAYHFHNAVLHLITDPSTSPSFTSGMIASPTTTVFLGGSLDKNNNYISTYNVAQTQAPGNPLTATSASVINPINLTYYASLPYGQDVAPGVYTDTVVIQVTF